MNITRNQLNKKLRLLKANMNNTTWLNKDYLCTKSVKYKNLLDRRKLIDLQMEKIVQSLIPEIKKEYDDLFEQIKEIEAQINDLSKTNIPKEIEDWFYKEYCRGTSFGYGNNEKVIKIVWLSDDGKYGIVTNKGHEGWHGRGTTIYFPARHWLIKIYGGKCSDNNYEVEGRLTKDKREAFMNIVKEWQLEEKNKI